MNFKNVLFIAPNYKKRKGGIASVMKQYEVFLDDCFIFLPSIYFQNIWFSTIFFPINIFFIITKLITSPSIKIVHIHGSADGSFYRKYIIFLLCKFLFKKKVVYHIHASHYNLFYDQASNFIKKRIQYLINTSDQTIVLSEEWLDYFKKTFNPKRIEILENIVPKVKDGSKAERGSVLKLLFLGRIGKRKGVFDLVECFKKNEALFNKKVDLFIGGDGNIKLLKEKIDKLSNVHYIGWVDNEKKREMFLQSDILILPSYNEGLPISILEAMSYGLPIISTNVGGIPRVLKNQRNGHLIPPGNKERLKSAIEFYIKNPELIKKHGDESLLIVKPYYPKNVFSKLEIIFNKM